MTTDAFLATLKRLTRGKQKLNKLEAEKLLIWISSTDNSKILTLLFPDKPDRKPKPPKPKWLSDMEAAKKRIRWSAAEAASQLYELAEADGARLGTARKKAFSASAVHVASVLGENRTRELFCLWVNDFTLR